MDQVIPAEILEQFSPDDIVDMSAYVDDCACRCRSHFTVQDGLINVHGRPVFDRLLVRGNLILREELGLLRLPDVLAVTGTVNIERCSNLKIMPSQMYVGDSVLMSETNVRTLPPTLVVGRRVIMEFCPNVQELPTGLTVPVLNAAGCAALETIPAGLEFANLDLSGTAVTSLPSLAIRNELKLRGCRQLTGLEEGVTVANVIDVRGCDFLFTLPRSVQPSIVVTDGMAVANNQVIAPKMSAEEASMCLGVTGLEAFPHRHFKNLERMQDQVLDVAQGNLGPLRNRAVASLKSKRPHSPPEFLRQLARRIDLVPPQTRQLTHQG